MARVSPLAGAGANVMSHHRCLHGWPAPAPAALSDQAVALQQLQASPQAVCRSLVPLTQAEVAPAWKAGGQRRAVRPLRGWYLSMQGSELPAARGS